MKSIDSVTGVVCSVRACSVSVVGVINVCSVRNVYSMSDCTE